MQNFIQKYEFYIWVYFKGGIKSEDEIFLRDQKLNKFFRGLKQKNDIFIGIKNTFNHFFIQIKSNIKKNLPLYLPCIYKAKIKE